MGNMHAVNCVLTSDVANHNVTNLLRRTCQRISYRRDKGTTQPHIPKLSKSCKNRITINTMPRCSSFEDISALLPSSKKAVNDPTYILWKKSFEIPRQKPSAMKQTHLTRMKRRVHDMSSVISGHLTPKGFPSHTHIKKAQWRQTQNCNKKEEKPFQLPLLDDSSYVDCKLPLIMPSDYPCNHQHHHHHHQQQQQHHRHSNRKHFLIQLPTHINNKTPITTVGPCTQPPTYTLAPLNLLSKLPESKQAIIIEKLYCDIKDLESYYDTQMDSFVL